MQNSFVVNQLTSAIKVFSANDHQLQLFENLWQIPQGVTYHSYLINDKQTALIDTVEERFGPDLLKYLKLQLGSKTLNYLILNHMEPDHSGTLQLIVENFPQVVIIGNHKTAQFVEGYYDIAQDQVKQIAAGEELDLGQHQLQFWPTPMVHWPESMVVFEKSSKTLFSSDIFGGYKTVENQPFADQHTNLDKFIDQARVYFATVVGAHTRPTLKSLKQLTALEIKHIAPAHGLVWRQNTLTQQPPYIFDLYQRWSQYLPDTDQHLGVTVVVGSMYGHTLIVGRTLQAALEKEQIAVDLLDASQTSLAQQLNLIWKNRGLIIGSCTYTNSVFPPIKQLLDALLDRKLQNKVLGIFSSHSWTGGAMRHLNEYAQKSKLELISPQFEMQYKLKKEVKKEADLLAANMIQAIKKSG